MNHDLFRMSDEEVVSLVQSLGGEVRHFPMVAIQSIHAVARGEHQSVSTEVEWLPLREGAERLLARARILRNVDPLKRRTEKP